MSGSEVDIADKSCCRTDKKKKSTRKQSSFRACARIRPFKHLHTGETKSICTVHQFIFLEFATLHESMEDFCVRFSLDSMIRREKTRGRVNRIRQSVVGN